MQSGILTTERSALNCILSSKENEMNAIIASQTKTPRNVVRLLQTLCTVLACASLVIGSVLISYVWFRMSTYGTVESALELTFLMTIVYLIPTLLIAWLFATTALLLARR